MANRERTRRFGLCVLRLERGLELHHRGGADAVRGRDNGRVAKRPDYVVSSWSLVIGNYNRPSFRSNQ